MGGDVILGGGDDRVLLLDTGGGSIDPIAESVLAFEDALGDPELLDDWFSASLADRLRQQGGGLGPSDCYGYAILPVFAEGSYGPENRRVLSALDHLAFSADVHRQIRDLPDGTRLRLTVVE